MNRKIFALLLSSALLASFSGCTLMNQHEQTCTVTGKESVRSGKGNQYRVYTSCGTLKVSDAVVIWRFDSADVYGAIQPGKTYRFKTGGYRVGFFSMFPNVIEVKQVK
jgi:hypothetical protein